jgi:hypothetical protein
MISNLDKRVIEELEKRGLTPEDLKKNYKYCGGNQGRHLKYFKLSFQNQKSLPEYDNKCICGHFIQENCYITDGENILIWGNCCINRFIEKSGRTCSNCNQSHRNRKNNLCNKCRDLDMQEKKEQDKEKEKEKIIIEENENRIRKEREEKRIIEEKEEKRIINENEEKMRQSCKCDIMIVNICICENPKYELNKPSKNLFCIKCNKWKCRCK